MEAFLRNQILNVYPHRPPAMQRNDEKKDAKLPHRFDSVLVDGDLLRYKVYL